MEGDSHALEIPGVVLAVDDLQDNLDLVEEILGSAGFVMRLAHSSGEALAAIRVDPPDCIVLDVMMPGMNGFELCRIIKSDWRLRAIPILMLTSLDSVSDRVNGLEVGADDFLNKPVDSIELLARVRSLTKIKRLHDELNTSEGIIYSMAQALDGKNPLQAGHAERVAILAVGTARTLGLGADELETIGKGALLHDLGKIGVSDEILSAERELTPAEQTQLDAHATFGDKILSSLRTFDAVRRIIRQHHERLDGSGHPEGIGGAELAVDSEIVAAANQLDHLTSRHGRERAGGLLRGEQARGKWRRETIDALLKQATPSQAEAAKGHRALLPSMGGALRGRVLVADDLPQNRALMAEYLADAGHEVRQADSAEALLRAIADDPPDVVVCDVLMPGKSGLELCAQLKAQPATEFLPFVLITAQRDTSARRRGIEAGADDFLMLPVSPLELNARVKSLLRMRRYFHNLEEHEAALLALATALEGKHPYTRGHSERVGVLAALLAREHGMPEREVRLMHIAGLLHDIGKIGVPDRILNKPGKLTADEMSSVATHPSRGAQICSPLRTVQAVLPLIRHHHERFDGSGYPDHLRGGAIPLGARVLAIADAFDALTSERSYRKTLPVSEAMAILERETGEGKWDPALHATLSRLVATGRATG